MSCARISGMRCGCSACRRASRQWRCSPSPWESAPTRDFHLLEDPARPGTGAAAAAHLDSGPEPVMRSTWGNLRPTELAVALGGSFSYPAFQAMQRHAEPSLQLVAFKPIGRLTALIDDSPSSWKPIWCREISIRISRIRTISGRSILPADDQRAAAPCGDQRGILDAPIRTLSIRHRPDHSRQPGAGDHRRASTRRRLPA